MPPAPPPVTLIFPWEHFQAVLDGQPLIGGKLWTYAAETSTPKASFLDPFFVTANPNPVVLDDQGAATVWLDGYYHLRLTDADDVLIWDVPSYTFASGAVPMPGPVQTGSTAATIQPTPGASTLTFPTMAPAGYRVLGTTWTIVDAFGTSQGLQSILLGDAVACDRWARLTTLEAGTTGGQLAFHAGDCPIAAPAAYTLLAAAEGGTFDGTGALHVTCYWATLPADAP